MGLPTENDSLALLFADSLYAMAQLSADPEVATLAVKIEKPREALKGLVAAGVAAGERTVSAEAARDRAFAALERKTEVLERKVHGVFAEEPKKAALIFKATTKGIFNSPVTTRDQSLGNLAKAVARPGLPSDLRGPAKDYADARKAWLAAVAAHAAAVAAEAEAIDEIGAGKRTLVAAMVEVHGLLRAKWSTEPRRADGYFRKRQKKATADERAQAQALRAAKAAEKAQAVAAEKARAAAKAAAKVKAKAPPAP